MAESKQKKFFSTYIKPIQHPYELKGIVTPKIKKGFFYKRDYFVQEPKISQKKLIELAIVTFTTEIVTKLGFSIIRHPNSLTFDYDYIFVFQQ